VLRWAVLLLSVAASAQVIRDHPLPLTEAGGAVEFLSPDKVTVPARHDTQVDLHFRVAEGLHINSHTPPDKYLIPARLAVVETQGLNVRAVDFPPGTDFLMLKEKLNVYTGEFVLHAHLTAQPGEHELQGGFRYQACDNNSCLPPKTLPVSVTVVAQ
jgi:hypothetical protein